MIKERLAKLVMMLSVVCALSAYAQPRQEWKTMKAPVSVMVVNDMGRNGYYDQKAIAATMGEVASEVSLESVVALGDVHHFSGVASVNDPLWTTNYELIYSHPELMLPWHPILGNHEYRGSTQAVLDYGMVSRRWEMPGRYYSEVWTNDGVSVRMILLDTTPLIDKYRNDSITYPDARKQDVNAQLQWLEKELALATEDWVIVAGHHPIYAYTSKADVERVDMQKRVKPLLDKYRVPLYVCGHIHNFQHIVESGSTTDYVVNSAAALSRSVSATDGTVFCSPETGFSLISADKKQLQLFMLDKNGNIIHTITKQK